MNSVEKKENNSVSGSNQDQNSNHPNPINITQNFYSLSREIQKYTKTPQENFQINEIIYTAPKARETKNTSKMHQTMMTIHTSKIE